MHAKLIKNFISLIFLFIILSLIYHQILKGDYYYDKSLKNRIRILSQEGKRGSILDRNKNLLVKDRISFDVCILPSELKERDYTFKILSDILGIDKVKLESYYRNRYIAPFYPVVIASDIDRKTLIALEEKRIFLPQVIISKNYKRTYLYKMGSHITGYLGAMDKENFMRLKDYGYGIRDRIGRSGIEEYFEFCLRGKRGGKLVEIDNREQVKRILGFTQPESGKDIQLTIDLEIQKICEDVLKDEKGSVIFMNPNNGEILALVSSPTFDPNIFIDEEKANQRRTLLNDKSNPLLNRAISGLYPPGSVFKLVVATASLEKKLISPEKRFFCKGELTIGDRNFRCWHRHDNENLVEAIAHSCNCYFYQLGLLIGPKQISQYALKLGLGRKTGIDLPNELKGFVPSPILRRWFLGDTANLSIGQGELLITPLQAVSLISIFANGGNLVTPHLLKKDYPIKSLGLNDETISIIRKALIRCVESPEGTAHLLKIKGLSVAGKTGTAQVSSGTAHGWFVGFLPFKKPKYSFCVFLENVDSGQKAVDKTLEILKKMKEKNLL